jgi:hypothetical protein
MYGVSHLGDFVTSICLHFCVVFGIVVVLGQLRHRVNPRDDRPLQHFGYLRRGQVVPAAQLQSGSARAEQGLLRQIPVVEGRVLDLGVELS